MSDSESNDFIVRLRGMPWSANADDVLKFLGEDVHVTDGKNGVNFTFTRDGRASGEAYVVLESAEDVDNALKRNNENMGSRYIEVFRSKRTEMEWCVRESVPNTLDEGIVRLRGIPFGCSKEEIANFFSGLEIVANGIVIPVDCNGRTAGDAYVQFTSKEAAEKALEKHKEKISHRYIEIFKSSLSDMESSLNATMRPHGSAGYAGGRNMSGGGAPQRGRPGPYDRMMGRGPASRRDDYNSSYDDYGYNRRGGKPSSSYSGQGHFVHLRGIPYKSSEGDIYDFFAPLHPLSVQFICENDGRPSGECDVEFASHRDARDAMAKNNAHMGSRYVELFLKSTPDGSMSRGHGGGGHGENYCRNDYDDYDYGNNAGVGGFRTSRNGGGGGNFYGGGHFVHMRGLPFRACEEHVHQFFEPLRPLSVRFVFDNFGRPSGECHVEFASHRDAVLSMDKNKAKMGTRYVELFLKSSAGKNAGNGMQGHAVPSYLTNDY